MPEVRVDPDVSRRTRLRVVVIGVVLVAATVAVRSTAERLHHQAREVRRLRARLAARLREADRQRREMAAVATAVEGLIPSAGALGMRAIAMREAEVRPGGSGAKPELLVSRMPRPEDDTVSAMRVIATLAWLDERVAEAGDVLAVQIAIAGRRTPENSSVPSAWPVDGAISSSFGWRRSPYGDGWEWHPGVDIRAAYGTPVRATADGEVVAAGSQEGYGVLVVLDHGAATTRYAHLSATWVSVGQTVHRGEPVGALGGTGRATAPHLHYEVRIGSDATDPECFLTRRKDGVRAGGEDRSGACALAHAALADHEAVTTAQQRTRATTVRSRVGG
jgi:murein DD-endopeptidase MepM/ murein hydrolase activator NlpD